MRRLNHTTIAFLVAAAVITFLPVAANADIYELGFAFSGAVPPDGPGPWLRAIISDAGSGDVYLTMQSLLTGPTEYVNSSGWLFNLDPSLDPDLLNISYSAGPYPNLAVVTTGVNFFQADGDGQYDISFNFPQAPPADRFNGSDEVTYLISYPGVDLSNASFHWPSEEPGPNGSYFTAAHVQGTGGGEGSEWIGSQGKIPEPTTLALLFSAGLMLTTSRFRRIH